MTHEIPQRAKRYENCIGGEWTTPINGKFVNGKHRVNLSPVNGSPIAKFPHSDAADIDLTIIAAQKGRSGGSARMGRNVPFPRIRRSNTI